MEGGSRVWEVTVSCVRMYKEGKRCEQSPDEACCTVKDKEVFVNVWSLSAPGGIDNLLTHDANELHVLVSSGWKEICSPIVGPSLFLCQHCRQGRQIRALHHLRCQYSPTSNHPSLSVYSTHHQKTFFLNRLQM